MPYNYVISTDDPQAMEKLMANLDEYKQAQQYMKDVNAYYRMHGTCKGFQGMPEATAVELDAKLQNTRSYNKQPFPSWALSNNAAESMFFGLSLRQFFFL